MKFKAHLNLCSDELKKGVGLNKAGKVQQYIDQFVFYQSEPYLPGKHLSTPQANQWGKGEVIWDTPDANYLYEGKLMVDPYTLKGAFFNPDYGFWSRPGTQKIMDPNGRDLEYHGNGLRGSNWYERMINDKKDDLIKGCQNIVNGGRT